MSDLAIISIVGPHGGDDLDKIINKKQWDVSKHGFAFWMTRSVNLSPQTLQSFGALDSITCLFITASGVSKNKPHGNAKATKTVDSASEFSMDKQVWESVPQDFTITGKLKDGRGYGIVISELERCEEDIDLLDWSNYFKPNQMVSFNQFVSSVCSIKKQLPVLVHMPSRKRKVLAKAKLVSPFGVWLR